MSGALHELLRKSGADESKRAHLEGRAKLVAAVTAMRDGGRPRAARAATLVGTLVAAAVVVLAVVGVWRAREAQGITYRIEGMSSSDGSSGVAGDAARMVFSDGSTIALDRGARGRVSATRGDGATFALDEGRARVDVVHEGRKRWSVDAGPWAVEVTGTAFTLAWSVDSGVFDLWMDRGEVAVRGPNLASPLVLGAGKHLHADARGLRVTTDGLEANDAPAPPSGGSPSAEPSASEVVELDDVPVAARPAPADDARGRPAHSRHDWSALLAEGRYDEIRDEARAEGEGRVLRRRSAGDLRALGDAARYTGDVPLARSAYDTLRRRFLGSEDARTALFLLGRLAEEREHDPAAALRFYQAYTREAPRGSFAADALGRTMALTLKTQGKAAARPVAVSYLDQFPSGSWSGMARDIAR